MKYMSAGIREKILKYEAQLFDHLSRNNIYFPSNSISEMDKIHAARCTSIQAVQAS